MASQVKVCLPACRNPTLDALFHITFSGAPPRFGRLGKVHHPQGASPSLASFAISFYPQQMRLIHRVPFSSEEIENYRQLVFNNLTTGMAYVLEAMEDMGLEVAEQNLPFVDIIRNARDTQPYQPFPRMYYEPLKSLWEDKAVERTYERGNEAALPEKYAPNPVISSRVLNSRPQFGLLLPCIRPPIS